MTLFDAKQHSVLQWMRKHAAVSASANTGVLNMLGGVSAEIIMAFGTENATWTSTGKYTVVVKHGDTKEYAAMETVTGDDIIYDGLSGVTPDWDNGVWMTLNGDTIRDAVKDKAHRLVYRGNKQYVAIGFVKSGSAGNIVGVDVVGIVHGVGQAGAGVTYANTPDLSAGNVSSAIVATT